MKTAVLSPHFDDAVLSCWGELEHDGDVTVVNVFTALPSPGTPAPLWDRMTGAEDSVERMKERRSEDQRALALAGRDSVHLDLLDQQYGGAEERSTESLVARLRTLLEPGTLVLAPAALSRHPDHEFVREAALELARDGQPLALYADLPHGITQGWPAWVTGEPESPGTDVGRDWAALLIDAGLAVERLAARVRPLDARARERKLRALAEYGTQRAALDDIAFAPLQDPRALAFEVSWEVSASALGGPRQASSEVRLAHGGNQPLQDRR